MNELAIWIDGTSSLIYFRTDKETAKEALGVFYEKCEYVGINTDNLLISSVDLRDENFNDIDTYEVGLSQRRLV